jgi:gliding motility-associated-like protein
LILLIGINSYLQSTKTISMLRIFVAISIFFFFDFISFSQKNGSWEAKDVFEKKCFIENLGQFDEHKQTNYSKIYFGSYTKGVHIYFTNTGIIFNTYSKVKKSRREIKAEQKWVTALRKKEGQESGWEEKEDEKNDRDNYKYVPIYAQWNWEGINKNINVSVSNVVTTLYCYPDKQSKQTLKAKAYRKLLYQNIYPNIDAEFYFPSDSSGIKFNYILHPGADVSMINEKWDKGSQLQLLDNGELMIGTSFGNFFAKKPVSFDSLRENTIETNYKISSKTISYTLKHQNSKGTVILDPWVVTPAFTTGGAVGCYDVDYDVAGNAYVYGGDGPNYELLKYDNAGSLIWTYATSLFGAGTYYGDFAIDQNTGNAYIVSGLVGPGSPNVLKISSSATFLADHYGSADMYEMWRITFSSCTNQAVIGGGGTGGTDNMCYLDTNLSAMSTINVMGVTGGCCYDMTSVAVDNYGSCYFMHANNTVYFSGYENQIVKCPMPTFLPLTYGAPTGFMFQELFSVQYYPLYACGFNGLVIGNKSLYAYDSYTLKKYNSVTGTLLINKPINTPAPANQMTWGGVAVDDCQNVFIGSRDTVFQYDSLLNQINFYPVAGTVYDVKLSKAGILYVSGENFATAILPTSLSNCGSPINPNLSVVDATCLVQGSASVSPTGGAAPYTIVWNTIPTAYGPTVSNLAPGTYTVNISDSSCNGNFGTATFTISAGPGAFATAVTLENISCNGLTDGSIDLAPFGGIAPYTYTWDTLGLTGSSVSGLDTGVYSVTITDSNGCINFFSFLITEPASMSGSTNAGTVPCADDLGTIVASVSGGNAPYVITWNTAPPVVNDTLFNVLPGIYSITVLDSTGCSYTFNDTLFSPPPLAVSILSQNVSCDGTILGSLTANVSGGTEPYDYSWSNAPGNNTNLDSNLTAGVYTLTVTDDNNCTFTITDTVFDITPPTVVFTTDEPCNGGSNGTITATPSGGSSGATFTYSWNTIPVQIGLVAANVNAGSYVLTAQYAGCNYTFPVNIGEDPIIDTLKINGVICAANDFATLYLPGIAQPAYTWFNSGTLIPFQSGISYDVAVTDISSITATWFTGGCRYLTTVIETDEYPSASVTAIPNVFSPNGDDKNNLFYAFTFVNSTDPQKVTFLFEEFSMQIFNRWGQLLFETNDPNKGWNGNDAGNSQQTEGVYFVIIKFKALCSDKSEEVIYNGTVQLVR